MKKQGRHHAERIKKERPVKTSRIVYLCISIVYLLTVCGATIYSLTAYRDRLPLVELIQSGSGTIPKSCLLEGPDSMLLNTVERQDGPWGKRYVIKQMAVYSYQQVDENTMFVYEAISSGNPIVSGSTAEYLYDGMEVRIS